MSAALILPFALALLIIPILSFPVMTLFDCSFEPSSSNVKGFCAWRPDNEQSALLWHNANAVFVDAANSLVHSAAGAQDKENHFAYAQGHIGSPTVGSLRSPLVLQVPAELKLTLSYWKASASPSLDICVEEDENEPLRCVDTVQGPGQRQWVTRAVELPKAQKPFRVVLRARNLLSAEDIVGVDDIRLLNSAQQTRAELSDQLHPLLFMSNGGLSTGDTAPKNPFDGMDEATDQGQKKKKQSASTKLAQTKLIATKDQPQQKIASPIRPQIRLSPSVAQQSLRPSAAYSSRPFQPDDQSNDPPPIPSKNELSSITYMNNRNAQKLNEENSCQAVSCSFLEGNCLWQIGPGWHNNSEGSLSIQSPVQLSQLASALFKPPLTSSVDFDLWTSDYTEISAVEQPEREREGILLFTRHGPTSGGWHRFRVPLRPSFSPVRLIFRIKIDEDQRKVPSGSNFVSVSNLKLVNGDGNEIGCETVEEDEEKRAKMSPSLELMPPAMVLPHNDLFGMHSSNGLQLPNQFPLPPPLIIGSPPSFPSPPFSSRPPSPSVGPPSIPFNPFSPMFEGILPIVPLRGNPPRLTALMDTPIQREYIQQVAEEEDSVTSEQHQQLQALLPIGAKSDDGGTAPTDESAESGEKRRHQLKRVIQPESGAIEVPQLVVLPKGKKRKWERKSLMNKESAKEEEPIDQQWPMIEMGVKDPGGIMKGKSDRNEGFRRRRRNRK